MKPKLVLAGAVVIEIVMAVVLFPLIDHAHIATTDFVNSYAAASIVRTFELYSTRVCWPPFEQSSLKVP